MSSYPGLILSVLINAAVTAKHAAYEDPTTGVAVVPNVAGVKCSGLFVDDTAANGGMAPVQVDHVAPAVFGGATLINDSLMTDAQGRMVKATGAAGTAVWCLGFSRSVIAQAGDEGDVLIHPHQVIV